VHKGSEEQDKMDEKKKSGKRILIDALFPAERERKFVSVRPLFP
jgi:hypothetical protein